MVLMLFNEIQDSPSAVVFRESIFGRMFDCFEPFEPYIPNAAD